VIELFADGDIVYFILGFMLIELIALILVRKKSVRYMHPLELIVSIGAGAALLVALREALRETGWQHVAMWLIVALGCHLWDLKLRWATRRTG
jgi:hypothetical protein